MNTEIVITVNKSCPHCEHELTPDQIKSLWSSYTTSLRQTLGGPERKKRPCQSCGMVCATAREAWSHCRIPRGLDAAGLLAWVLERMPEELKGILASRYRRHTSLEALQTAVNGILATKLTPAGKRQVNWYLGFIEKALNKLEKLEEVA